MFPTLASIQPEPSHRGKRGPASPLPQTWEAEIGICQARGLCNEQTTIPQLHDIIVTRLAAFNNSLIFQDNLGIQLLIMVGHRRL